MFLSYKTMVRLLCLGPVKIALLLGSSLSFAMDVTPPIASFVTPTANQTFPASPGPTFSGLINDWPTGGSGIANGQYLLRNLTNFNWINTQGNPIAYGAALLTLSNATAASANWQLSVNLPTGSYRIYIRGRDTAGNLSAWRTVDFFIGSGDNTAPAVTVLEPTAGGTQSTPDTMSGRVNDTSTGGSGILSAQYMIREIPSFNWVDRFGNTTGFNPTNLQLSTISATQSSWSINHTLPAPGDYRLYVRGTDTSFNTSSWTVVNFSTAESDQTPPVVRIINPTTGLVLDTSIVNVTGSFNDTDTGGSQITGGQFLIRNRNTFEWLDQSGNVSGYNPAPVTLNNNQSLFANWSLTANLGNGNYRFYARGQDSANNLSGWRFVDFTVDGPFGLPPPPPPPPPQ